MKMQQNPEIVKGSRGFVVTAASKSSEICFVFILGCQSDSECLDTETCVDGTCINPCLIDDPCGANAVCFPKNHVANCRCNEGFEGDPFVGKCIF